VNFASEGTDFPSVLPLSVRLPFASSVATLPFVAFATLSALPEISIVPAVHCPSDTLRTLPLSLDVTAGKNKLEIG